MKSSKKRLIAITTVAAVVLLATYALWRTTLVAPVFVFESDSSGGQTDELFINGKSYGFIPVTFSLDDFKRLLIDSDNQQQYEENAGFGCGGMDIFTDYGWQFRTSTVSSEPYDAATVISAHLYANSHQHTGIMKVELVGPDGTHKRLTGVSGSMGLGMPQQRFLF